MIYIIYISYIIYKKKRIIFIWYRSHFGSSLPLIESLLKRSLSVSLAPVARMMKNINVVDINRNDVPSLSPTPQPRPKKQESVKLSHQSVVDFSMPLTYNCKLPFVGMGLGPLNPIPTPTPINDNYMVNSFKTIPKNMGFYIYSVIVSLMKKTNAFIMGGWVRDTLIGGKLNDIDIFVRVNNRTQKEIVAEYFRSLIFDLFRYIYGHLHKIDVYFNDTSKKNTGYSTACLKTDIFVDNTPIISIDFNRYDMANSKDARDANTNIDFIQNGLAFKYVRNDCSKDCIVLQSEVNYNIISPNIKSYIKKRTKETLASLVSMFDVKFKFKFGPHIAKLLTKFLGSDWLYIQTIVYTICKRTPEMCACHHRCHLYSVSTFSKWKRQKAMLSRCSKFSLRGFNLINMNPCCEDCLYMTPSQLFIRLPLVVVNTVNASLFNTFNKDFLNIKGMSSKTQRYNNKSKKRKYNQKKMKMKHQVNNHYTHQSRKSNAKKMSKAMKHERKYVL